VVEAMLSFLKQANATGPKMEQPVAASR
jgi:hypothetical protein